MVELMRDEFPRLHGRRRGRFSGTDMCIKGRCKGWYVVKEENNFPKPVKASVIRRLVRKITEPTPTREEKLDVLRRLFRKYSTSTLSKFETKNIIKRFIELLSATDTLKRSRDSKDKEK